jgi:hypothetical protein
LSSSGISHLGRETEGLPLFIILPIEVLVVSITPLFYHLYKKINLLTKELHYSKVYKHLYCQETIKAAKN